MHKPAPTREFLTSAEHYNVSRTTVGVREQKAWTLSNTPNIKGKFNQKSSAEITANGLTVFHEKITFVTWYKSDLSDGDKLKINGIDYVINGVPDNTESRGRYSVCNLERVAEDG